MNGMAKKESLIGRKIVFEINTELVEVSDNTASVESSRLRSDIHQATGF